MEIHELEYEGFCDLVDEIRAQGYDAATAARFACLIGDTPIHDEQGRVLVMDGGTELARLRLEAFSADESVAVITGDLYSIPDYESLSKVTPEHAQRLIAEGRLHEDANELRKRLAAAYQAVFGNYAEIALPEFKFERRFDDLVMSAIKRGRALTREEVEMRCSVGNLSK